MQEIYAMTRILIIDDDDQCRHMLRQTPEGAGYEVVEACNGHEGLQRYHAAPTDVMITDILMPEQEDLETIMALRRTVPGLKIITISGGGQRGNVTFLKVASRLGAQRVLQKPFGLPEILAAVREMLAC